MQEGSACRNIFKSGRESITSREFTRMWIDLINQLERSKAVLAGSR